MTQTDKIDPSSLSPRQCVCSCIVPASFAASSNGRSCALAWKSYESLGIDMELGGGTFGVCDNEWASTIYMSLSGCFVWSVKSLRVLVIVVVISGRLSPFRKRYLSNLGLCLYAGS